MTIPTVTGPVDAPSGTPSYERLLAAVTRADGREVLDPTTGEVVGSVALGSPEDLDAAVARVRAAQPAWAARPDAERTDLLLQAADAIEAAAEPLAQLLSREQGKPLNGPDARLEAGTVWIESHGGVHPMIPFGGVKESGYGPEFGAEGLKAVAVPQVVNG